MNPVFTEEWRPVSIPEYAAFYEVSNMGRVRSLDRVSRAKGNGVQRHFGKEMKLLTNKRGYVYVYLRAAPLERNVTVHQLVAKAFIPNPDNLIEVNHLDTIKGNNVWTNLEWTTRVRNHNHAVAAGIMPRANRKLSDDDVDDIIRRHLGGYSQAELALEYDVRQGTISRIVNGLRRTNRL